MWFSKKIDTCSPICWSSSDITQWQLLGLGYLCDIWRKYNRQWQSDFVCKAIFVGDEGEVGFVAVSDLPFNDEGVQYLQTKINEHWGYHNYIVIGATIPEGKESVGVEISIDLGELKLKTKNCLQLLFKHN